MEIMATPTNTKARHTSHSISDSYLSRGIDHIPIRPSSFSELIDFTRSLHKNSHLSDFTITCQGEIFEVHRFVLASRSAYFGKVMRSDKTTTKIKLDYDPVVFDICLGFMYMGTAVVDVQHVDAVANLCEELGIIQLRNDCLSFQYRNKSVTKSNCLEMFEMGLVIDDKDLIEKTSSMVLTTFESWRRSKQFLKLSGQCVLKLLAHPGLKVKAHDQRLSAALVWLRADASSRASDLLAFLKALPITSMNDWFLSHALEEDPLINADAKACSFLNNAIEFIAHPPQHDVVITGSRPFFNKTFHEADRNIYALMTSMEEPSQVIATIPSSICIHDNMASCLSDGIMFVSCLGEDGREVWKLDIKNDTWSACGKLGGRRERHCMCVCAGNIYVMGGGIDDSSLLSAGVEVMEDQNGIWKEVGLLQGTDCYNTCCTQLGDDDVVVYGVFDQKMRNTLQVYSTVSNTVTHTLSTRSGGLFNFVYGVLIADDSVIMVDGGNTYMCPVSSVYSASSGDIQPRPSYKTPNDQCAVYLTQDRKHVIVLGGDPRPNQSPHYAYQAAVSDIIHDQETGWERVDVDWGLGRCQVTGGAVCTGLLTLPSTD